MVKGINKRGRNPKFVDCYDPERGKICLWSNKNGRQCAVRQHPEIRLDYNGCGFARSKQRSKGASK